MCHSALRIPHWVRSLNLEPFVDSAFRTPHSALGSAFVPSYLRTPLPLMFIPHSAFSIPHSEDSAFRTPHWVRTLYLEPFVDSAFPNPHSAMEETLHLEPFVDSAFPNRVPSGCSAMEETLHLGPAVAIANYQSLTPKTRGQSVSNASSEPRSPARPCVFGRGPLHVENLILNPNVAHRMVNRCLRQ